VRFLDADALSKWIPPNGFTCKVHHQDAKGRWHVQDVVHQFHDAEGPFVSAARTRNWCPAERLRYTDKFRRPETCPGEIQVTITLKKVMVGTEVNIEQAGIPAAIPPEMCYPRLAGVTGQPGCARRAGDSELNGRVGN